MADDPQRNFRSAYYEKVGFRGVEEKKSLEILMKDNPLGKSHHRGLYSCSNIPSTDSPALLLFCFQIYLFIHSIIKLTGILLFVIILHYILMLV